MLENRVVLQGEQGVPGVKGPEGPRVSFVLIRSKFVMFTVVICSDTQRQHLTVLVFCLLVTTQNLSDIY